MTDLNPRLEEIAKAAAEISTMSSEEAFEVIVKGISKVPEQLQAILDSVVAIQFDWPMPTEGWKQFVEDIEYTNKKYGLDLHIDPSKFLDPLNIVDAQEKYAASINKTRDELDENERKQAVMNAVLAMEEPNQFSKELEMKCPDCNVKLEFGQVKDLRGGVYDCVWFCPECVWPFYGKEHKDIVACPSLDSDIKNFDYAPKEKEMGHPILVGDSEYRQELLKYRNEVGGNMFGLVLHYDEATSKYTPITCSHGGSGWLCPTCAVRIISGGAVERLEKAKTLIQEQAGDEGLWFMPQCATEVYLQNALRKLQAVIEGEE